MTSDSERSMCICANIMCSQAGRCLKDQAFELAQVMQYNNTYQVYRCCLNCGVKQNINIPVGKVARDFKCPICGVSPKEIE
jgi:hypothetical protein